MNRMNTVTVRLISQTVEDQNFVQEFVSAVNRSLGINGLFN